MCPKTGQAFDGSLTNVPIAILQEFHYHGNHLSDVWLELRY